MAENTTKIGLLGKLSVVNKIGMMLSILSIAMLGIVAYTIWTLRSNKASSLMVEIASRQQVLSQRHMAEVMMAAQGITADYQATRKIFLDTLHALSAGGQVVIDLDTGTMGTLPPAPTFQVQQSLNDVREIMSELIAKSDALLAMRVRDEAHAAAIKELMSLDKKLYAATAATVRAISQYGESRIDAMVKSEASIAAIVMLVALLLSWKIVQGMMKPLRAVVDVSLKIAQGNLMQERVPVTSEDEIGQLTAVINTMMENLKKMASTTWGTTEKLSGAANEIYTATQQQASSTKQQAATVQQTTATMEQIRQSGHQIAEKAKEVASVAEVTNNASQAGIEAVDNTRKTMDAIRSQFESVAEHIITLSEKAQAVSEIITNVNDIAEQSNLLALNASIEAASAGEHGRSFAVVANEIKNLADQAKQSTFQVRAILGEIQKGINSSVMLAEEAVKRVESGRSTVELAQQTITQMARTTQESINAFQQIMGATSQQQIGLEQMTQAMKDILQASQQTASSTSHLEKAVSNLNALGQELRKGMEAYRV